VPASAFVEVGFRPPHLSTLNAESKGLLLLYITIVIVVTFGFFNLDRAKEISAKIRVSGVAYCLSQFPILQFPDEVMLTALAA